MSEDQDWKQAQDLQNKISDDLMNLDVSELKVNAQRIDSTLFLPVTKYQVMEMIAENENRILDIIRKSYGG